MVLFCQKEIKGKKENIALYILLSFFLLPNWDLDKVRHDEKWNIVAIMLWIKMPFISCHS